MNLYFHKNHFLAIVIIFFVATSAAGELVFLPKSQIDYLHQCIVPFPLKKEFRESLIFVEFPNDNGMSSCTAAALFTSETYNDDGTQKLNIPCIQIGSYFWLLTNQEQCFILAHEVAHLLLLHTKKQQEVNDFYNPIAVMGFYGGWNLMIFSVYLSIVKAIPDPSIQFWMKKLQVKHLIASGIAGFIMIRISSLAHLRMMWESRYHEFEADEIAIYLLKSKKGAIALFKRWIKEGGYNHTGIQEKCDLTHPTNEARLARIKKIDFNAIQYGQENWLRFFTSEWWLQL